MAKQSPMFLFIPDPAPRALRDADVAHTDRIVVEVCGRCWGPYLAGKLDEHLLAIPHRRRPLESQAGSGT